MPASGFQNTTKIYGNYYNALGDYGRALELYNKAIEIDDISDYAFAEITLEMGKLYDILGDRRRARASYWKCEKSGGLILHREEEKSSVQRLLKDQGHPTDRPAGRDHGKNINYLFKQPRQH